MNIQRKIFISMIALTVVCGAAVLAFSMFLFSRELYGSKRDKVVAAATVLENEIKEMKVRAQVAAFGMARNPELIEAIVNNDRDGIIYMANSLKTMTQIDFCNIIDTSGYVITRTHAPDIFGDNISNQPHVRRAMDGYSASYITQGAVILLGVYAGTPIYDGEMNMIGVISLGFRLDVQEFAYRLKDLTGCEISAFLYDKRVSTTLIDDYGTYALGEKAPQEISNRVLAGESYISNENVLGKNALIKASPLISANDKVIGKIIVCYYTAQDDKKIIIFFVIGIFITLAILVVCVIIAALISKNVERQLNKSQENMRKARDDADAANRSKSVFLANMSHEIRTPMNSIIGFSELALDDDISAKTRKYLENITDNGKWLLNIINDILDSAKIESDKMVLEHIHFDLKDVISQCQAAILPKFKEKGIRLFCYAESFAGKKLFGDPVRLRQVFMNLLSNAVKFTSIGTVKLLAAAKNITEEQVTVSFEVKDSGIGMTAQQIARIFEPFNQADDSITRNFGGTGLGLAITKKIIELMGGAISVESSLESGSKFCFDLTFDYINAGDAPSEIIVFDDLKKPAFTGEILICEDNDLNLQVICEHLARVGLKTVSARNGKEGVDIVRQRLESGAKPFDIIFLDIHMPVMDGLEAASKITEMGIKTPLIALTANIMSNELDIYRTSGIPDYLGKPFTSQELWQCLIKYLPSAVGGAVDENLEAALEAEEEEKSLKRIKILFIKSQKTAFDEIKKAIEGGDIKLAHRLAHTLKSNAGQIKEKKLQEAAAACEKMLENEKCSITEIQMNNLKNELDLVLEKLNPLLAEEENKKIETADKKKALEIIGILEPMLAEKNPQCINLVDDIRAIPGAEELARFVDELEFKPAKEELVKLKESLSQS